ncbi:MAG: hypothetical protein M3P85_07395 [Actinomycetota bacterium]|nr:hypothetical protein [Actinomycetota bacterium]
MAVAHADAGTGMGRFAFSAMDGVRVSVPADAYAGAYRSELSLSVASGP